MPLRVMGCRQCAWARGCPIRRVRDRRAPGLGKDIRMYRPAQLTVLAAAATLASLGAARKGEIFSWNPHAVKLNGTKFSADTMFLRDSSQVVLHPDGTFIDAGY